MEFHEIVIAIAVLIVVGILIGMVIGLPEEGYIYECTDFYGNLVYCTSAYTDRGGMFGITEDGTRIVLTSYKQIPKTERKDIETKE